MNKRNYKKIYFVDLLQPGPLCNQSTCPRPIDLPRVNYIQNTQRSPCDNRFGTQSYALRYAHMIN